MGEGRRMREGSRRHAQDGRKVSGRGSAGKQTEYQNVVNEDVKKRC